MLIIIFVKDNIVTLSCDFLMPSACDFKKMN